LLSLNVSSRFGMTPSPLPQEFASVFSNEGEGDG
jgi:hypothetical protein